MATTGTERRRVPLGAEMASPRAATPLLRAGHDAGEPDLALYSSLDATEPAALVPEGSALEGRELSGDGKWVRVRWRPADVRRQMFPWCFERCLASSDALWF